MTQIETEIWKAVPSIPGVEASSLGRIRQSPVIALTPTGGERTYGGTPRTGSWDGERYVIRIKGRSCKVARLVCEAFHGPAPADKPLCLHDDENSRNNRPGNLCWGTGKQNQNAPGFLRTARARAWLRNRAVGLKINVCTAAAIRGATGTNAAVAAQFGVSPSLVSQIRNGHAWRHA